MRRRRSGSDLLVGFRSSRGSVGADRRAVFARLSELFHGSVPGTPWQGLQRFPMELSSPAGDSLQVDQPSAMGLDGTVIKRRRRGR